jgi:predicted GH43/DUF377 family glycosyl hydrolase
MKNLFFKLFLLITFLFLSSGDLLAQVDWTKYPSNPVLTGQPGTWYAYTTMNSVLYNADSSRYEMWFTAGAQIPFPYTIGFAKSVDGISWDVYSIDPVLSPAAGEWDAYAVLAPYVLRENGQYKMWYTGCATSQLLYKIGYATSLDGINWTKHPNPVFEPGPGSWESGSVAYPCIMSYSNGYKMWYGGGSNSWSETAIGYATSPDGINWERYFWNPILFSGSTGQWDHLLFGPRVLEIDNRYYMFYSGEIIIWNSDKIGLATSSDGLTWTKYPSNPVLQPSSGQWDGGRTNSGYVLLDDDTLKMYYCGMPAGGTNMQLGLATSLFSPPVLPGTYTVGTGGNFATIQDAFNKLETDGVAGDVTLELIDDLYIAPTDSFGFKLNGPIPGAGPNSSVTIKPAANKNVVIEGSGFRVISFVNTSYLTLDGIDISGTTTLALHANKNNQYPYNDCVDFLENSDHNIFQNITIICDDITGVGGGVGFYTRVGFTASADSNLIQNNFIKKSGKGGIYVSSYYSPVSATGNIIRENQIGSESDSLIAWGIQIERCKNTIVENNIIQNLKSTPTSGEILNIGINSYSGNGDVIRNNVIHNIKSETGYTCVGILLSGGTGINNMVYNNMVYDIQSASTQSNSRVAGIQIWSQEYPKIYYNTVYLSGTGNGANPLGSAALYIDGGNGASIDVDLKNNIFVNTRDESPYCASAVYDYTTAYLTSDYNDLYYDDTNNNNCLVRIGSTDYHTLAEWQATGKDLHSYVEMPHFISSTDLHIDGSIPTYIEGRGMPINSIENDIDGDLRNTLTPDIGADEIDGTPGVGDENVPPTEYALEQNYPNPFNPGTTFRYSIPQTSKVVIKVFDILGNEIATLMDEEKSVGTYQLMWNAADLSSGIYFYQLTAGDYVNTKKMILLK